MTTNRPAWEAVLAQLRERVTAAEAMAFDRFVEPRQLRNEIIQALQL